LSVKGNALEGADGIEEEVVMIFFTVFSEKGSGPQEFVIIPDPSILPHENEQNR
jgi:hypothetical protein